jgi:hypothetical protein
LTPQNLLLLGLAISTGASFLYAFIAKKKGNRMANIALAIGGGLKKAVAEAADKKAINADVIVDAVYEFAAELNVSDAHIEQHLPPGASSGTASAPSAASAASASTPPPAPPAVS